MRRRFRFALSLVLASLAASLPARVEAQGFFQNLFGGGGSPPPNHAPRPALHPSMPSPYGYRAPLYVPSRPRENSIEDSNHQGERAGRYRTMCVRMCDGYYWPVSFATTRSSVYRDANYCRASCGEEARLFFHSAKDGDTSEMVDLTGRAYSKLPVAYRYRKTVVEGCKCKPDPWAQSELDRHHRYALNETAEMRWRKDRASAEREVAAKEDNAEKAARPGPDVPPPEPEAPDPAEAQRREIGRPIAEAQPRPRGNRPVRGEARANSIRQTGQPPAAVKSAAPAGHSAPYGLGAGGKKSSWPGD